MPTLKDIADRVGVSVAAVSRVLNHDKSFSITNATRQMILEAAQELQYVPSARKQRHPMTVALVMLYSELEELEDPYYLSIRANARKEAVRQGYSVLEFFTPLGHDLQGAGFGNALRQTAGVIVIGSTNSYTPPLREQLIAAGVPVVLADFWTDEPRWDYVYVDFRTAVNMAMDHLVGMGYERIGFIGARERDATTGAELLDLRERYYEENRRAAGRYNPADVIIGKKTSCDEGYALMRQAISAGGLLPRALFVMTDNMAIGAIKALKEDGIAIPEQVAVVGYNDIPAAAYLSPSLTTVRTRTDLLGVFAHRLLNDRINNERDIGLRIVAPCELIVRQSSGITSPADTSHAPGGAATEPGDATTVVAAAADADGAVTAGGG